MAYDPNNPDSAEPGELLDVILEELDAALVRAVELPDTAFEYDTVSIERMLGDAEALADQLNRGIATPTEADDFARRCRKALDRIFGTDTASTDPMAYSHIATSRKA